MTGAHMSELSAMDDARAMCASVAYLALTFENVSVSHAHAFNIALLLAVDPPHRSRGSDKTGRPDPSGRLLYNGFASALVSATAPQISPSPEGG